jgi:hypothetical protein
LTVSNAPPGLLTCTAVIWDITTSSGFIKKGQVSAYFK